MRRRTDDARKIVSECELMVRFVVMVFSRL
jgi:hypothetical protein